MVDERSRADAEDLQPRVAGSLGQAYAFLESPTPVAGFPTPSRDRLAQICSERTVPTAAPRAAQSALGADVRNLADPEDGWAWVRAGSRKRWAEVSRVSVPLAGEFPKESPAQPAISVATPACG